MFCPIRNEFRQFNCISIQNKMFHPPGHVHQIIRELGAQGPQGSVLIGGDELVNTERISIDQGNFILEFELHNARWTYNSYDDFDIPLPHTPAEDHRLAPICASCGNTWHGPYGGPPEHIPGASATLKGEAAKWISLQVYRKGVSYKPWPRKWYGFARPANIPGAGPQCGTQHQIHIRVPRETSICVRYCWKNAKQMWPHLFEIRPGVPDHTLHIKFGPSQEIESIDPGVFFPRYPSITTTVDADMTARAEDLMETLNPRFNSEALGPRRWEQIIKRNPDGSWDII